MTDSQTEDWADRAARIICTAVFARTSVVFDRENAAAVIRREYAKAVDAAQVLPSCFEGQ